jgi:hypothetical protein
MMTQPTFRSKECITDGCRNRVHDTSYWKICIDCYGEVPNHIPLEQANLYCILKRDKEHFDVTPTPTILLREKDV